MCRLDIVRCDKEKYDQTPFVLVWVLQKQSRAWIQNKQFTEGVLFRKSLSQTGGGKTGQDTLLTRDTVLGKA